MKATPKNKRIKYSPGSVIAIPIKDNRYAFAKTFNDGELGVYDLTSDSLLPAQDIIKHSISFYQYGTHKSIKNGDWPILGVEPFALKEDAVLPPMATCYDRDTDTWTMSKPMIYHNGKEFFVTPEKTKGLDIFGVCISPESIVHVIEDRLIKGNHDNYKVKG
jgi:hypothetical protein